MSRRSPLTAARILRGSFLRVPLALGVAVALAAAGGGSARAGHAVTATASWKIVKTVRGKNFPHFTAVTATSRHGAWAFEATSSATAILRPFAWRLHGSRWTRASFPGTPGEQVISAASTSPGDVWAVVNRSGRPQALALRRTGRSWAVTGRFPHALSDVVALSRREAWVFGDGAWHFNGHRWAHPQSGHGLLDGSALSPDSIWASGLTVVAHWNGHTWSRTSVKGLLPPKGQLNTPGLTSIYAQSSSSVWAVGTTGEESQGGPVVLLHFNGHRWHHVALADAGAGFPGQVIPDGTGGLWIPFGFIFKSFKMLHYAGGQLQPVALPVPRGAVLQVAAAAAVPGRPQAIAVGGTWPAHGPIGGYTRAVILAYGS